MARYGPSQRGNYGRFFTGSGRRVSQHRSSQGQGSMNAFYSGANQLVRHSVGLSTLYPSVGSDYSNAGKLGDQKAVALPLIVYGTGGSANAVADESELSTIATGSRVNNVQIELQIAQSDTAKPNNCYIGFISTSFSDAALNAANMTSNFNDLIEMSDATTGEMALATPTGSVDMSIKQYNESPFMKHWIRGFNRYAYTLYSGRPAILKTVLPTPPKNRRGQFGMGWWLVMLNDSSDIQGEGAGDGTDIHFSANTYFKEIQDLRAEVRTTNP